jgi:3-oxoacyl-[acyl-carrier-protein] synthase-3
MWPVKSRFLDRTDRETALLFGDGAGAALLTAENSTARDGSGIVAIRLYADGSGHDLITVPGGGSRLPLRSDTIKDNQHVLRMKGGNVFRAAVRRLERALRDLLNECGLATEGIDHVVVHQANARILDAIRRRLAIPVDRMYSVIERYGNTSSASLPIALDCAIRDRSVKPGDLLLLGAFGGGFTWATGLVRW